MKILLVSSLAVVIYVSSIVGLGLTPPNDLTWNTFLNARNIFPAEHETSNSLTSKALGHANVIQELKALLSRPEVLNQLYNNYLNTLLQPKEAAKWRSSERQQIFKENLIHVAIQNLKYRDGSSTWYEGVTHYVHLTKAEFQKQFLTPNVDKFLQPPTPDSKKSQVKFIKDAPASFDWRDSKMVSPVKNQWDCGDCYAFQACAVLESAHARGNNGEILDLSEEDIRDCMVEDDPTWDGCDGALPGDAYNYVQSAGGLPSESDYPYNADKKVYPCTSQRLSRTANVDSFLPAFPNDESDETTLINLLNQYGPIGIFVDASAWSLSFAGGRYSAPCVSTDHAVTLVGYNEESFIIKNSYGHHWGDKGYLYLDRGSNACCITNTTYIYIEQMA